MTTENLGCLTYQVLSAGQIFINEDVHYMEKLNNVQIALWLRLFFFMFSVWQKMEKSFQTQRRNKLGKWVEEFCGLFYDLKYWIISQIRYCSIFNFQPPQVNIELCIETPSEARGNVGHFSDIEYKFHCRLVGRGHEQFTGQNWKWFLMSSEGLPKMLSPTARLSFIAGHNCRISRRLQMINCHRSRSWHCNLSNFVQVQPRHQ